MCRTATVESVTKLVCLVLDRRTFIAILGPLEHIMQREKSSQVVAQRLMKLQVLPPVLRVFAERAWNEDCCFSSGSFNFTICLCSSNVAVLLLGATFYAACARH